jgi:hypothetical protein
MSNCAMDKIMYETAYSIRFILVFTGLTIGTHIALILCTINLNHLSVHCTLISRIHSNNCRAQNLIDILNSRQDTLSQVS